jgi:hypothetical protein
VREQVNAVGRVTGNYNKEEANVRKHKGKINQ